MSTWWQNCVFYEVYVRTFCDSNGDGVGDLNGVLQKLDYFSSLGIGALWLSPFYPSSNQDGGYDVVDYCAVDPVYGTMEDFDRLSAELHKRHISVVVDLVLNHTSDQHEWFQRSRRAKKNHGKEDDDDENSDSYYRDFYYWRPAGPNREEPNNWQNLIAGSAWEFDEVRGEYYLHLFTKYQPDLNWENPKVRQKIFRIFRFWLQKGVRGFRLDAISLIAKNSKFENAKITVPNAKYQSAVEYIRNDELLAKYLREMILEARKTRDDAFFLGEALFVTIHNLIRSADTSPFLILDSLIHLDLMNVDIDPALASRYGKWSQRSPKEYLPDMKTAAAKWQNLKTYDALYLENHDQPRSVSRFGNDATDLLADLSAKMLATWIGSQRGVWIVYNGEEIGMQNPKYFHRIEDFRDSETLMAYEQQKNERPHEELMAALRAKSRDNSRTPMQWNAQPWPAPRTTSAVASLQLPSNPNTSRWNVEALSADSTSVLNYFRKLIALRTEHEVLRHGKYVPLFLHGLQGLASPTLSTVTGSPDFLVGHLRVSASATVLVLCSWSAELMESARLFLSDDISLLRTHIASSQSARVLLRNYSDESPFESAERDESTILERFLVPSHFRPYEALVILFN